MRFLPSVNEVVFLQITIFSKWLVALGTFEVLISTEGPPVMVRATSTCKSLRTQVTRLSIYHLLTLTPSSWLSVLMTVEANVNINCSILSLLLSLAKTGRGWNNILIATRAGLVMGFQEIIWLLHTLAWLCWCKDQDQAYRWVWIILGFCFHLCSLRALTALRKISSHLGSSTGLSFRLQLT